MKKILLTFLAVTSVFLNGCTAEESSNITVSTQETDTRYMVTLGDSIAAGFGLQSPDTERFSAIVEKKLGEQWNDYNYAVSGDDSTDLLKRLNDGRAVRLPAADIIVIDIGSNNFLKPYGDYLQKVFLDSAGTEEQKASKKALDKDVTQGLKTLEKDIASVYSWIRERNHTDKAKIYLMNTYNPYADLTNEIIPSYEISLADYSQSVIDRANKILSDYAEAHRDIIYVDVQAAFQKCEKIPINGQITGQTAWATDPHPTAEGHKIIADTLYQAIEANWE